MEEQVAIEQRARKAKEYLKPICPVCNIRHAYKDSLVCCTCKNHLKNGRKHQKAAEDYIKFQHLI